MWVLTEHIHYITPRCSDFHTPEIAHIAQRAAAYREIGAMIDADTVTTPDDVMLDDVMLLDDVTL
jgi:hypothetical protein